jgi:hypothetical protein
MLLIVGWWQGRHLGNCERVTALQLWHENVSAPYLAISWALVPRHQPHSTLLGSTHRTHINARRDDSMEDLIASREYHSFLSIYI